MAICYSSFDKFVDLTRDIPFRYWVYKRMFTPYEQERKFVDETAFEDPVCIKAFIRECVPLPNGEVMLGLEDAEFIDAKDSLGRPMRYIRYYNLKDIHLEMYDGDLYELQDK